MTIFSNFANELRTHRLLAVVIGALVVALIAVPIGISTSSSSSSTPAPISAPATSADIPGVQVTTSPAPTRLPQQQHNPFAPQKGATKASSNGSTQKSSSSSQPSASSQSTKSSSSSTSTSTTSTSTSTSTSSSTTTTPTTSTPSTTPTPTPTPEVPATLSPTEQYEISMSLTDAAGGVRTVDPVMRLSIVPNAAHPMLVELGVLRGGRKVLFAVGQGTHVSGADCIPGRVSCEVIAVTPHHIVTVGRTAANGTTSKVRFAVTGINVKHYHTPQAAHQARAEVSSAGKDVLSLMHSSARALFSYSVGLGAVIDHRNVTVGATK